ncbi:endonuclease III [Pendulispora rubella]|uniref:Endonuclease III n=1 Tax=Pendulispora rubella TaxID=2741070 RepID=A0ABZ2LGH9_9BACT
MAAAKKKAASRSPAAKKTSRLPPGGAKKAAPSKPEKLDVFRRLAEYHADAHCELDHKNAFELLCATVLSAQSTDVAVNKLTPALFARYPDAQSMASAKPEDLEELISRIGMYRQKTKSLLALSQGIVENHGGEVPRTLAELTKLRGVGRKTANVVLGVAFGTPEGVVVDTHVQRISQRLGWTKNQEPPEIEQDLCALLPRSEWDHASHVLIFHGRRVCGAIKPNCEGCPVNDVCPCAFRAEQVGRKAARAR